MVVKGLVNQHVPTTEKSYPELSIVKWGGLLFITTIMTDVN
jgi:hypothetical protein